MAGEQLQKTLDVDLTQLDSKLKQEEVLWKSIDERSEVLEKKLQRQKSTVTQLERQAMLGGRQDASMFGRAGMRLGKKFTGNAIASGISMVSSFGGPLVSRLGNLGADAIFSGANIARGGIYGAILWGINEQLQRIQEEKERREKLEALVTQYYEDLREEQFKLKLMIEDEERERQEREDLLDIKAQGEAKELIYQSSQFLDQ